MEVRITSHYPGRKAFDNGKMGKYSPRTEKISSPSGYLFNYCRRELDGRIPEDRMEALAFMGEQLYYKLMPVRTK